MAVSAFQLLVAVEAACHQQPGIARACSLHRQLNLQQDRALLHLRPLPGQADPACRLTLRGVPHPDGTQAFQCEIEVEGQEPISFLVLLTAEDLRERQAQFIVQRLVAAWAEFGAVPPA